MKRKEGVEAWSLTPDQLNPRRVQHLGHWLYDRTIDSLGTMVKEWEKERPFEGRTTNSRYKADEMLVRVLRFYIVSSPLLIPSPVSQELLIQWMDTSARETANGSIPELQRLLQEEAEERIRTEAENERHKSPRYTPIPMPPDTNTRYLEAVFQVADQGIDAVVKDHLTSLFVARIYGGLELRTRTTLAAVFK